MLIIIDLSATTVSPDDHTKHRIGIGSGDGDISMSSVYLLTMVGMFFIAGFMHLGEFTDLVHGSFYIVEAYSYDFFHCLCIHSN